mmetsp:Transcript_41965/g.111802  ORF Transcript_41965/g.111802 Transcript_41965/m.111802 type:complete len:226 (+) Transcript_41965:1217-1894(+)
MGNRSGDGNAHFEEAKSPGGDGVGGGGGGGGDSPSSNWRAMMAEGREDMPSPTGAMASPLGNHEEQVILYPAKQPSKGKSYLSLRVHKVGLKDYDEYVEPFISVVVCDKRGRVLETQNTPVAYKREKADHLERGGYLVFDQTVHLQTQLEHIYEGNSGIFFELKHWKDGKKKTSCRCWALVERDEIEDGEHSMELYKKPADYRRRKGKITLFSVTKLSSSSSTSR